jgi:Domain of unknown function (DUF5615)
MPIQYLLDENMAPAYYEQLQHRQPNLVVVMVGDCHAPPKGTLDPEILNWCEENDFILVTNNRRSMPVHLKEHLAKGRHLPGILALRKDASFGRVLEDLVLVAEAADEDEFRDRIDYIPW